MDSNLTPAVVTTTAGFLMTWQDCSIWGLGLLTLGFILGAVYIWTRDHKSKEENKPQDSTLSSKDKSP